MQKHVCNICHFVYDPVLGWPEDEIEPGTPFEEVPADWTCPECGVSKDEFEPLER